MTNFNKNHLNIPFNDLPVLRPKPESIETIRILRQLVNASVALAELKGLAKTLPNPNILLNAIILNEASASSEIENVVTTALRNAITGVVK